MNQMLRVGQTIDLEAGRQGVIKSYIGSGGQGEVYEVVINNQSFALKWYFPEQSTEYQRNSLQNLLKKGPPNNRFLWPLEIVSVNNTIGYLMPLRSKRFKSITDLMSRKVEPSFRALCTTGYELADSFLDLHSKGLCYRDISFSNVFFDPDTGHVQICDNDNVAVTGEKSGGILGTPRFMAPEIVRGEAEPSIETDLFSLAILLFYVFMLSHPLEGERESKIKCFDLPAMRKLYGEDPIFIWDEQDLSNRPVMGYHDNAIVYWALYPEYLKELFTKVFTMGIKDTKNGRVRESEWRKVFIKMRDNIVYCHKCGAENFEQGAQTIICWDCNNLVTQPPKLKIGRNKIMLNYDAKIYPHHIGQLYNFRIPIGEVTQHPDQPDVWGIKNLSKEKWHVDWPDGTQSEVLPERSFAVCDRIVVNFGSSKGKITF